MSYLCGASSREKMKAQAKEKMFYVTHYIGDNLKNAAEKVFEHQAAHAMSKKVNDLKEWLKSSPLGIRQLGFITGFLIFMNGFVGFNNHFYNLDFLSAFIDCFGIVLGMVTMGVEYSGSMMPGSIKNHLKEDFLFVYRPFARPMIYLFCGLFILSIAGFTSPLGIEASICGILIVFAAMISTYHTFQGENHTEGLKKMDIKKSQLLKAFNKFDKSGDGKLDTEEFLKFLHEIDLNLNSDDLEIALLEIDESHDEEITFDEFLKWYERKDEEFHV